MAEDEHRQQPEGPPDAWSQLRKAFAGTGERAKHWQQAVSGWLAGALQFGTRSSNAGELWLTRKPAQPGADARELAAGGALLAHEQQILSTLGGGSDAPERTRLNLWFVAGQGRLELERALCDGRFRIELPEEGALLAAAWLHRHGEAERSAALIAALAPCFDRVRFYPQPQLAPLLLRAGAYRQTVGEAVAQLRATRPRLAIERMHEAITIWTPLYDRAVGLFLETVQGERPTLQRTASGEPARGARGELLVVGGWPCCTYPADWRARARALLDEFRSQRQRHRLCAKPDRPRRNFARLRAALETCVFNPAQLSGREVGLIRLILAAFSARHGAPDSVQRLATRTAQRHIASRPRHVALAHALAELLERQPEQQAGLPELDDVLGASVELPRSLRKKASRCLEGPLALLVERRVFGSGEALATIIPALIAQARAAAIGDLELRRVVQATYLAFWRHSARNEVELQFGALPWIAALEPWTGPDELSRRAARDTLVRVATVAIQAFPERRLPNQLIKQLRALAVAAGLNLTLVYAPAADRFRGQFSANYAAAARIAAAILRGTLYERYYALPYERVLALDDTARIDPGRQSGPKAAPDFSALCAELAGAQPRARRRPCQTGDILEQAELLTTHNLAALFSECDLARSLDTSQLARKTFGWICQRQQRKLTSDRARRRLREHSAIAWRQLVFYLALQPPTAQAEFFAWSSAHLSQQRANLQHQFAPQLAGLRALLQPR